MRCYCCSETSYENCCKPIIDGDRPADTPEQLMRSRFSAYCVKNYRYILETYAKQQRRELSTDTLKSSAEGSRWFALNIQPAETSADRVTFKAFYFAGGKPYQLHETSVFIKENNQWRYECGTLHNDTGKVTIGRNETCPCLSGKKFKQCCLKRASH